MKGKLHVLLTITLVICLSISVYASETAALSGQELEAFLEELEFRVEAECCGHPSFVNYLVREDGVYAVFSISAENTDTQEGVFSRAYIDLFNKNAEFLAEISFSTRDAVTLQFSSDTLQIYLSEHMLSVDLSDYDVQVTRIPRYFAQDNGLTDKFQHKSQEADGWRYCCEGSSMRYTSLVREKDGTEEVLLSWSGNIPGTGQTGASFAVKGILSAGVIILLGIIWKVRRRKSGGK